MMVLINLVVMLVCLAVAFAIGYGVFLGLWIAGLFLLRVRRKWLWGFASLPVFGVLFVGVLAGLFFWATSPSTVFANAFGFPPPTDATDLRSKHWVLGDSGSTYLAFKATNATIQQITQRGLTPATTDTPLPSLPDPAAPNWWRPASDGFDIYFGDFTGRAFATVEYEVLYYDPATGQAYFYWFGVD